MSFANKLAVGFAAQRHLCVGIDPHSYLLTDWGLPDSAQGAEIFGRQVVAAAAASNVLALKPQIAFFERFGSAGFLALERIFADARQAGVTVIADVKRGDIGSTFAAYAEAWLSPGSPLEADAITAAAYQGFGSLNDGLQLAQKHGKGLFVLAATSNHEAKNTQQAVRADGQTVAQAMISAADRINADFNSLSTASAVSAVVDYEAGSELPIAATDNCDTATAGVCCSSKNSNADAPVGAVGVVLGATLQLAAYHINTYANREAQAVLPILAPGFGAQGAELKDAKKLFGNFALGLIPNESRSVLAGGSDGLAARINARAAAVTEALYDNA